MFNSLEKVTFAGLMGELIGTVLIFMVDALVLWLVCGVLLPVFPWLACLAGLTYWDWVGLAVAYHVLCRWVAKLFKAVWAK